MQNWRPLAYNINMNQNDTFTTQETAKTLNVSTQSIRRLCNQGLIPHVRRDQHRRRVLESWQVDLIAIILGMKQAGFRPKEIRQYARLFRQGRQTESERLAMLTTRKRQLWHEIEARQKAIDFIERQEEIAQIAQN